MRGSRSIVIHFACNDGRNGLFAGEVENIVVDLVGGQIELYGWARRFTVDDKGLRLCIHGVWFPFMSSRDWVGNWCWNAYRLKRPQAVRLLSHLRWHGWKPEAGRVHACRWFEAHAVRPPKTDAGVAPTDDGQQQPDLLRALELGRQHAQWSADRSKDVTERRMCEHDVKRIDAAIAALGVPGLAEASDHGRPE